MKNIVETASSSGAFENLLKAIDSAGLRSTLTSSQDYTIFAPSDEAFAKIPRTTLNDIMQNPKRLRQLLNYHIVPRRIYSGDLSNGLCTKTMLGKDICFDTSSGTKVENSTIIDADIQCTNGIIHTIDTVMMP